MRVKGADVVACSRNAGGHTRTHPSGETINYVLRPSGGGAQPKTSFEISAVFGDVAALALQPRSDCAISVSLRRLLARAARLAGSNAAPLA
jgi:hypothetical protein